jgi:magnesium transporter
MRLSTLLGPDLEVTLRNEPEALHDALDEVHPEDIAEIIETLAVPDALAVIHSLPAGRAADVTERLPPELQVRVLTELERGRAAELLGQMDPDDRVDVVQELDADEAQDLLRVLAESEPEVAEQIRELVMYGPDTAGGLMTTEFVACAPDTKVWQGIEEVRRVGHEGAAEMIYYTYVVGYGGKLLGVVSLRDLILADPGQELAHVMTEKVVTVAPLDDQEKVAEVIARYDLSAVPVVDDNFVMVGVVTIDDVVDVVIEEATEDAQMMGGMMPLEDGYFATSLLEFIWKRGAWLVVLFLGQMLTATVMERNQRVLAAAVELVIFIPLIISSGGNAGSQSSTLIIRGMALGEIAPRDWLRVIGRELGIGLALGALLGSLGAARAVLTGDDLHPGRLAFVIGGSIVAVVTLASVIGSLLPLAIRKMGFDPAVSSTPFIASVVDVLGLIVYFGIAQLMLTSLL